MTNSSPDSLRLGDHGVAVNVLQQRLAAHGQPTAVDGWYGPATERAVRAFQLARGLVADGIAGPRTQSALLGGVDPRWLTQADIQRAAVALGGDVATIQAVIEVESPRGGFLPDGRLVILFERHVFWQRLVTWSMDPDSLHAPANILSQQRGGYVGGVGEYTRLQRAVALAGPAHGTIIATEACSLGRFQIMGYHASDIGYTDAAAMATAFAQGEAEQLAAFVRFLQRDDALLKALRSRKWPAFAKAYNGPAYADNLYDAKLASAYARHAATGQQVAA